MKDANNNNYTLDMTRPENMQVWVVDAAQKALFPILDKYYYDVLRDKCEAKAFANLIGGGSRSAALLRDGGVNCEGTTKKGQPCKKSAGPSGFCHVHARKNRMNE